MPCISMRWRIISLLCSGCLVAVTTVHAAFMSSDQYYLSTDEMHPDVLTQTFGVLTLEESSLHEIPIYARQGNAFLPIGPPWPAKILPVSWWEIFVETIISVRFPIVNTYGADHLQIVYNVRQYHTTWISRREVTHILGTDHWEEEYLPSDEELPSGGFAVDIFFLLPERKIYQQPVEDSSFTRFSREILEARYSFSYVHVTQYHQEFALVTTPPHPDIEQHTIGWIKIRDGANRLTLWPIEELPP